MNDMIKNLSWKFMELYNQYIEENEYDPLLTNGYCFYFAMFLKKLFPEGEIYYAKDHYIFFYEEYFYDGNGIIPRYNNVISLMDEFYFIQDLYFIEDIEKEQNYREITDFDAKQKDKVWSKIEPILLSYAKENMKRKKTLKI